MTISELTAAEVAACLRIDDDEINVVLLQAAMDSARDQILSETGLTAEEADGHADLTTAYLALVQDAYDNVGMQSDGKGINAVKDCILGLHRRNLL